MMNKLSFYSQRKLLYIEQRMKHSILFRNTLFLSLFTFSLHLFLRSFDTSILMDAFPELILDSYFSTFSLYNLVCILFYTIIYIIHYTYMTFGEVNENKWYTLIKAGYSQYLLIFMKLGVRMLEVFICYSLGFVLVFILTTFLKYPLTISYLLPLFLSGLIDMMLLSLVVMALSLFIHDKVNARYVLIGAFLTIQVLRITSGYYGVISDRTLMMNVSALFDYELTNYFIYVIIITSISLVLSFFGAKRACTYTNFYFYQKDMDFDNNAVITVKEKDRFREVHHNHYVDTNGHRLFDIIINAAMSIIIAVLIFVNVIVLAVSVTSLNRNWNFLNIYPYVFQSNTMEPTILFNDLVFFKGIDSSDADIDEIILYRSGDNMVNVARVVSIQDGEMIVDYDRYPDNTDPELLQEKILASQVEGEYMASSRWLGLLVLFANTMLGRLFMLILPSILIFFYQPIVHYIEKLKQ